MLQWAKHIALVTFNKRSLILFLRVERAVPITNCLDLNEFTAGSGLTSSDTCVRDVLDPNSELPPSPRQTLWDVWRVTGVYFSPKSFSALQTRTTNSIFVHSVLWHIGSLCRVHWSENCRIVLCFLSLSKYSCHSTCFFGETCEETCLANWK